LNKSEEKSAILNAFMPLVEFLSNILGSFGEVVLHDVSKNQESILAISKNTLTGRKKGGVMSPVGKKALELHTNEDYIINNLEKALHGKDIRSNTYFIKDSSGEMIGMLCVNLDITAPLALQKMLNDMIGPSAAKYKPGSPTPSSNIEDYVLDIINDSLHNSDIPPERMTPDEKKLVVKQLNQQGIFRIKGGVSELCRHLQISEATLYRYLKDIK